LVNQGVYFTSIFWGLFFFFSITEDGASKHPAQKKTQDFYQLFAKIHRYGLIGV